VGASDAKKILKTDWSRETLGPYRDCPEIRCKVVHDVTLGAVSIGSFEVSR